MFEAKTANLIHSCERYFILRGVSLMRQKWEMCFQCVSVDASKKLYPGIPTTIKTTGVDRTTIAYLKVLIIEIGSTIISMVVEAQGIL